MRTRDSERPSCPLGMTRSLTAEGALLQMSTLHSQKGDSCESWPQKAQLCQQWLMGSPSMAVQLGAGEGADGAHPPGHRLNVHRPATFNYFENPGLGGGPWLHKRGRKGTGPCPHPLSPRALRLQTSSLPGVPSVGHSHGHVVGQQMCLTEETWL